MNNYQKVLTLIISGMVLSIIFIVCSFDAKLKINEASRIYNVYLKGKLLGSIENKNDLFELIDTKQEKIKEKYGVAKVYPPNELNIIDSYSYNTTLNDLNTIYNKIEEIDDFTIKGYEVSIKNDSKKTDLKFYVLDKEVFKSAVKQFVLAFIDEDKYNAYVTGTQEELSDIGVVYQSMFIEEKISFKEKYISINEKIYTDSNELAQVLLFGKDSKMNTYKVVEGDTIASISDSNELNVQEFLIANPNYKSETSLLQVGANVNITLINPILTFSYSVYEISEVELAYEKEEVRDNDKPSGYSEITQRGITGIVKLTQHYDVVNGEPSNNTTIDSQEVIREKVNQVTTKGRQSFSYGFTTYVDTGGSWGWPTESPYVITSYFAPRWGRYHNGIDISGTGDGSKIYAASSGTVVEVYSSCASFVFNNACGGGYGNHVIIDHGNNLYTLYGHLTNNVRAYVGMNVSKGTVIGYMGNSGRSYGTHLHFGASRGYPGRGGSNFFDPRSLYK